MNDVSEYRFSPVSEECHARLEAFADAFLSMGMTTDGGIRLNEKLHAGCYVRTVKIPADMVVVSDRIECDTLLIVNGDCVFTDSDKAVRITGYRVLLGARGRQSLIRTLSDTYLTMIFATDAKTFDEAQALFSADPSRLTKFPFEEI